MVDQRLQNEIEHGKFLASHNAGEIWNWETPAGKIRWGRRVGMLTNSLKSGMKVLEIGCGIGFFTKEIIKKPVQLTAIDISPELIEVARKNILDSNVEFIIENAYQMAFEDQTFDAVIGSSVLHHLDVDTALKEIYRVLTPEGYIAFTEPNMMNPQIALQKNIPALKKALGDSPDESAFFIWSIRKKLKKTGFTGIDIIPFDFLHPRIPKRLIETILPFTDLAEKIPLLKQISGSLYIKATK
ncbi:MAG: methyltransferase domain-containing protein [Candidatus Aminicenantes bacterium]|nr:methyltransferase domain-containing protein [Candidatus Aminicenantes bacterium]